jgi:hypothetical protein
MRGYESIPTIINNRTGPGTDYERTPRTARGWARLERRDKRRDLRGWRRDARREERLDRRRGYSFSDYDAGAVGQGQSPQQGAPDASGSAGVIVLAGMALAGWMLLGGKI